MNVLSNQTTYQCEYCNKRFISKNGAKLHEEKYCYLSPIKKQKDKEKILSCNHKFELQWSYIPGEAVMEPDHEECIHCGVWDFEWRKMNEKVGESNEAT